MASDEAEITVVVPVFRNADTLQPLAARLLDTLSAASDRCRVMFVVDRCPSGSWEVVRSLASSDPRIAGLLLEARAGQHAAVLAGLEAAASPWVVVMDADLQDPPERVPAMLARAREIEGTVFARREGRYERWDRMLTSRVFKRLLRWTFGVPEDVGTFFVVPQATARRMCALRVTTAQVVVMAFLCSERRDAIPVTRQRRHAGRSAYSSRARLRAAYHALRCARECRRALTDTAFGSADGPTFAWPRAAERVNA